MFFRRFTVQVTFMMLYKQYINVTKYYKETVNNGHVIP